ncbi:LytTR family DNA-binding domain-containing protein [Mucilaginibacter roseus]|uniref:LytTR family DNA-binding domain-containing protein n=1 Tax=Mucilaginibacter roseus TaxID=1528868 RepID=A0ABS8TWP3_9SPHI|nr:LytTR family DNA-binding domain-containing protein [Mucilaginibacter roseus]MCD8739301.1 LytTR family DNA-binding domain-containing protein [Mucilaginibacter roseus]
MLKVLIVDDEPLARQQLEAYASRLTYLQLAGVARNVDAANDILSSTAVDLILLDIQMPKTTGIEFLKSQDIAQQVILVTAFPEYAIEGFELAVTDYLLKPVTFERFTKACERALANVSGHAAVSLIKQQPGYLYVRCDQRLQKIRIADVLFIEAMANYVHIILANKKYTVYSSLKGLEAQLPADAFVLTHRSYLVAVRHIDSIGKAEVLIGENRVPLSRSQRKLVQSLII